jgi:flotillin
MFSLLTIGGFVALGVFAILFVANMYKRCSSDEVLVVFGSFLGGRKALCIHGGGRIVIPLVQGYKYMSLKPITIDVDLHNALSKNNIRVSIPSAFNLAISTDPTIMANAAERILNFTAEQIAEQAKDIIVGQLRQVVASMTIEDINKDRDSFLANVNKDVETELNKIGLHVINVNIKDISDESGYIEAIGKKAAAEAINQANIDVAHQERLGAAGVASATREREVEVANQVTEQRIGTTEAARKESVETAKLTAEKVKGENEAKAAMAEYNASLAEKEAEAVRRGDVAKAKAQEEVLKAEKATEQAKLEKEELAKEEVEKKKVEVKASAEAEQKRLIARGEADAVKMKYDAEAEGIRKVLEAKAEGIKKYVEAAGGDPQAAASMLMIEIMPKLVETQVKALENIKIDKVVVWDGGQGEDGGVGGFVKNMMGVMPPLHEVSKMAGLKLPEYLGTVQEDKATATEASATTGNGKAPKSE